MDGIEKQFFHRPNQVYVAGTRQVFRLVSENQHGLKRLAFRFEGHCLWHSCIVPVTALTGF